MPPQLIIDPLLPPLIFVIELGMQIPYPPPLSTFSAESAEQWMEFLIPIRTALQGAGLSGCTINMKQNNDYSTWCLTNNRDSHKLFDIVSPRLTYQDRYSWTRPLSQIYSVVRRMDIIPSNFWGTRIHIAPAGVFYQWQINAIAKSVFLHNNGFNSFGWDLWTNAVHADARARLWIPGLSSETRVDIHRAESAISPEEVARLMDRGGAVSHIRPWNFWPLVPLGYSSTGFVEYNLAPGSRTEQDAYVWINFVCLFVRGAIQSNGNWNWGSPSGGQRALFIGEDLQIFILEQADEVNLSEMERESLRQRLECLGGLY